MAATVRTMSASILALALALAVACTDKPKKKAAAAPADEKPAGDATPPGKNANDVTDPCKPATTATEKDAEKDAAADVALAEADTEADGDAKDADEKTAADTSSAGCGTEEPADISKTADGGENEFFNPAAKVACEAAGKPFIHIEGSVGCFEGATLVKLGADWCKDKASVMAKFTSLGYSATSLEAAWAKSTAADEHGVSAQLNQCGVLTAARGTFAVGQHFVLFVAQTKQKEATGELVPAIRQGIMPKMPPF